jgi:purine catabolism regulator
MLSSNPAALERSERSPASAHAAMLDALVAGEGLARVAEIAAEHVGEPVGIFVPRPGSDGSDGDAAERYVAELVAGGDPPRPPEVAEVVPITAQGELQGAVLMFGEDHPEAFEYLRVAAVAAVTGVAMLNARQDAARETGEDLVADLLGGEPIRPGELVRRAGLRGCDLTEGVSALCINPGEEPGGRVVATVAAQRPDALAEVVDGRVYVLVPGTLEPARKLAQRLTERVTVALSSRYREAGDARLALEESELLLLLAEASGRSADSNSWDSLRLLFRTYVADPEELQRFSEQTVGELVRHDERQESELQVTFWAYQESNCNMNLTAKATYTHRHTVSNRLNRIEELTGLDPSQSYQRELLSLALKAHYVISMSRPR